MANSVDSLGFVVRAMLCDSCISAEGKLYIQGGGWDRVSPGTYPGGIARVGLAVTIEVPYTATNKQHKFVIRLVSEDGLDYGAAVIDPEEADSNAPVVQGPLTAEGNFTLGRPPHLQSGESQMLAFALNFDQLVFEHPGAWNFLITINGQELERVGFRLTPATP